ncbi:L,D-transpeptidase [Chloroflexus sp.]|uniref:L,D-transpeptidase n=1 Tax=Chloroflexus sp. TaxID=1904827 RepID=UPI0026122715|nr:L,D-transpeptidase [uncultured Chloroflexus sp.]
MRQFLALVLAIGIALVTVPAAAQSSALYFVATGQRLDDAYGFLSVWRSSDGPLTLGQPISPAFRDGDLIVQYFERGRLELHPAYNNAVLRGRVGAEYATALGRAFPPPTLAARESPERRFFAETGYTIGPPFLAFWEERGAVEVFGFPISEPRWEYVDGMLRQVQYFERARLEVDPRPANPARAIQIGNLGRDLARLRGVDLSPVAAGNAVPVDANGQPQAAPPPEQRPAPSISPTATPTPKPPPARPAPPAMRSSDKLIIVDLSDQWLYALDGDRIIFDAPVSTGRDGFNTPIGTFAIYAKVREQTMRGCAGNECWVVPRVPHAMYIVGGVALHGTYWHNQFGTGVRRSHGCVNLPLKAAAWLYDWAPVGTTVIVRR